MNEIIVAGSVDSALTHFAASGLSEILVDAGVTGVAWSWRGEEWPEAVVEADVDSLEAGSIVLRHAMRLADPSAWPHAEHSFSGKSDVRGFLSPRIAAPSDAIGWKAYEASRRAALDSIGRDRMLDHRFIASLGRPSYWTIDGPRRNSDAAASRWEMKTRNRGEHFVGHRLGPLAERVAARTPQGVIDGIVGRSAVDEAGKNAAESRTSTGLTRPGPTDNALAWCGLWGLAATATWWDPTRVAATTAVAPAHRTHPDRAVLPVFNRPITPAGYRNVLRSDVWQRMTTRLTPNLTAIPPEAAADVDGLIMRHVRSAAVFPIEKVDNPSAPERYLLAGVWIHFGGSREYR